ncbi:MAG: GrpB family protein [Clostridia bacterium]
MPALEESGFIYRKHNVADVMLFVCRDKNADIRTHHIHVVRSGNNEWYNYINFRNYWALRAKT